MQQKTYASPIFTSQILTDNYAGRDNTSSGPQNRAVIAVIRTLSKLNTAFTGPQYGLYKISMDLYRNTMQALSERNTDYRSVMNIVLF